MFCVALFLVCRDTQSCKNFFFLVFWVFVYYFIFLFSCACSQQQLTPLFFRFSRYFLVCVCVFLFICGRLIIAWRYDLSAFIGLSVTLLVLTPAKFLGELLKSMVAVMLLGYIMCTSPRCSGNCWLGALGGTISVSAGWAFYLRGRCSGWHFKEWRRVSDRACIPYHVVSDVGNALWIIALNYNPSSSSVAFDVGMLGNETFPACWWR